VTDPFPNVGLGVCTGVLLILADWAHTTGKENPSPS